MKYVVTLKMTVLVVLLFSMLSACASLDETTLQLEPAAAWPNKTAFDNAGTLYKWDSISFKLRVQLGYIGGTPDRAVVPLLFGSDGRLKKSSELRGIWYLKKNASTTAKGIAYLRSIGVYGVYFTDMATYKRVMSAYSRYSTVLTAYAAPTTSAVRTTPAVNRTVRYFNPYVRRSAAATSALVSSGTKECASATALPVSEGFPAAVGFVGGTISPDGKLLPQQYNCVANCGAQQILFSVGCTAVPWPLNFLCLIAAAVFGETCINDCY